MDTTYDLFGGTETIKIRNRNDEFKINGLTYIPNFISESEHDFFKETPDQVIVNEYMPGQGITNHIDCPPCFSDTIASLSLGSQCVMNFTNNHNKKEIIPYLLDVCSIVVLKGEARYDWMHGIKLVKYDTYFGHKIKRGRRVSLTFRKVILES